MRQLCHHGDRNDRWVWTIPPDTLEDLKTGLKRLSLDDENIELDDMFPSSSCGGQGGMNVSQDLLCLSADIAFSDDRS